MLQGMTTIYMLYIRYILGVTTMVKLTYRDVR